jgi:hypothetical protein
MGTMDFASYRSMQLVGLNHIAIVSQRSSGGSAPSDVVKMHFGSISYNSNIACRGV